MRFAVISSIWIDSKEFHRTAIANQHKRAAFTIKWLKMTHPIQINEKTERSERAQYPFLANAAFAVEAGLNMLEIDFQNVPADYLRALIYKIQFRPVLAETLLSEMALVERIALRGAAC
ncbi:MAG: hypothetical protein HQL82_14615 [Magnetococcales bacterium]|nr:hypothetical protein [Magnetococcales bacterium]